jgi:hypothetical protein
MKRSDRVLNRITSWSVVLCVLANRPASVLAQNPSGVKEQLADRGMSITTLYGGVLSGLDGGRDKEARTPET